MKIYVASSWRNKLQPKVVKALLQAEHEVYDFRNTESAFHWSDIDRKWELWSTDQMAKALDHPLAQKGFKFDKAAIDWADVCVMVLPCGRSASLEAGYFAGAGKPLAIFLSDGDPEVMYNLATAVVTTMEDLLSLMKLWA